MPRRSPRLPPALLALALVAPPAYPVAVTVTGVEDSIAERAREASGLPSLACEARRWRVRRQAGSLEEALARGLRPKGHYTPTIQSRIATAEDCWQVAVEVDPGPRAMVRSFEARLLGEGADDPVLAQALAERTAGPGDPFAEPDYVALKAELERIAYERGYFDAAYRAARVDVWPEQAAADVTLIYDTGPRYALGEVVFALRQGHLRQSLLERYVDFEPGEPYTSARVDRLRRQLLASGYFDTVDVFTEVEARDAGRVPVRAELTLRPRHLLTAGVGFATDYGPRVRAGYANRFINAAGHQASLDGRLSPVQREIHGEWRMPLFGPREPWLSFDAGYQVEDTDTSSSRTTALGMRHVSSRPPGWRLTQAVELTREAFRVGDDDDTATLLMPSVGLARQVQRSAPPLETGYALEFVLRGALQPLASTNFVQLTAHAEYARRLGERTRILTRADLGTTVAESLSELPASLRFFAGGDRSVRGYGFERLGPRDRSGEVVGGRHLATVSVELERLLTERWSWAVFVDHGQAFNEIDEPRATGVGAGLRWSSPIGPVRLDVGVPLDEAAQPFRFHLGVGATFQ